MSDKQKTKAQLLQELGDLRRRVSELEREIAECKRAKEDMARLATFTSENPNPVLRVSDDCTVLYANNASSAVLETWRRQVGQRLPEACCKRAKEALDSGKVSTFEFSCDDGRVFLVTLAPAVNEGHLNAYGVDITERRKAEERRLESEKLMRAVFDATTESIVVLDNQLTGLAVNETAARRLGKSPEELVGFNPERASLGLMPPAVVRFRVEKINEVICSGKPIRCEDQREGRIFDTNMYPIFDAAGKVARVAIFARDITEQRQVEGALREAKLRYEALFENIPIGVGIATYEGRILGCNKAMLQMQGYGAGEIEHIPLEDTYVDPTCRTEFLKRVRADGKVPDFEVELKRKDGTHYWASLTVVPLRWDGQEVLLTAQVDVSARKRAEAALRESENRYRTLVESAGESIAVVDSEGVFLFMNTTAAERLGGKPEEYIGRGMWDLFPREIADRQVGSVRIVIRTGQGMNLIAPTTLQGKTRWHDTTIEPLQDANGRIDSALIVARDIHELQQAQEELEEYRNHMAHTERLAALGTLSATVAHEMNQPLTVIRLTIQNCLAELEEAQGMQEVVDDLKECLEEVSTASSIVDRFKGFARHSSRRGPGKTNLQGVAEKVVRIWDDAARRRNISLVLDGLDRLGKLCVDERDMEQVFFSLVENAIQAADGTKDHRLLITGTAKGEAVELRFADDCGGIAPEHIKRILDPFFTTKSGEGTGLGLCIVEQALSRVGGKLQVENRPKEGVTFVVTLPFRDKPKQRPKVERS